LAGDGIEFHLLIRGAASRIEYRAGAARAVPHAGFPDPPRPGPEDRFGFLPAIGGNSAKPVKPAPKPADFTDLGVHMDLSDSLLTPTHDVPTGHPVRFLDAPVVTRRGIEHRVGAGDALLEWDRVVWGIAAMVGEPEGVCTIVFDLLVEGSESKQSVCRFDADPSDGAIPISIALVDYLGSERCGPSLLAMAKEGSTGLWYPDLESFEAASPGLLRKR
jgi:hypothetical protein